MADERVSEIQSSYMSMMGFWAAWESSTDIFYHQLIGVVAHIARVLVHSVGNMGSGR